MSQDLKKIIITKLNKLKERFDFLDVESLAEEVLLNTFEGMETSKISEAINIVLRPKVELDPRYSLVVGNVVLDSSIESFLTKYPQEDKDYRAISKAGFIIAHENGLIAKRVPNLLKPFINKTQQFDNINVFEVFDIDELFNYIRPEEDTKISLMSATTLYDRYFLHVNKTRVETMQGMLMRVAIGLSIKEDNPTKRAKEFYDLLASFDYMSSTPTLFNAGTQSSQLSSCYLTTIPDDLDGIFNAMRDDAMLSKHAGGLGNDWTQVRALGSHIKGTNGESSGIIPFLNVANATAVAVNQSGKRKGAFCAYLESWHLDVEEFLELRKNTGDDRRRTHDMNTANWVPDLFMKRVITGGKWTLFSPSDVPHLHDLYGSEFEAAYEEAERKTKTGEIKLFKEVEAIQLWRKMLAMVFETGHPWITFKDPCNIRSPQTHAGVVHSSNLCVAPETVLLTKQGQVQIEKLAGQEVEFWNGHEWTIGPVAKTGENQKLLNVVISSGKELDCTEYHKWYIETEEGVKEVRTHELKAGDKLIGWVGVNGSVVQNETIVAVNDFGRISDTYCCTDPKRHMAVFNGILTGQCTEITLNTSVDDEIAVCNLGSVNLKHHVKNGKVDNIKLMKTVKVAVRMLDNVIDINYYPVEAARNANARHRPVGLGIMGFQDVLQMLGVSYSSEEAVTLADQIQEVISYAAIEASHELALERGSYQSFEGSDWSKGILPIDTVARLKKEREGFEFHMNDDYNTFDDVTLDWTGLREKVKTGMRNSNVMAIAPTATISNIVGATQSIEPTYQNLFVKSNLSGEFTVINEALVDALQKLGMWDKNMLDRLKVSEGSIKDFDDLPDYLKAVFQTSFDIDPIWIIKAASARQKWIDQAQSLNLYIAGANGKKLDTTYKLAWTHGLKTTYYLRALAATTAEKSTVNSSALNSVKAK